MVKQLIRKAAAITNPQCRFDRAIFLLGHMRCGSTAMSHVICSRPEISGYGEAHIDYSNPSALGSLMVNQTRRQMWKPKADYLFDKVLHSRYDAEAVGAFYQSRAIFMIREPGETIRSIRKLFTTIGSGEYASDEDAAVYYEDRLTALNAMWRRFPANRKTGLTYEEMTAAPDAVLTRISSLLSLKRPLENRYSRPDKRMLHGAGDPLSSHKFDTIMPRIQSTVEAGGLVPLDLVPGRIEALELKFQAMIETFQNNEQD